MIPFLLAVSLITSAVSEKMSAFETIEYIEMRAKKAGKKKFEGAISHIPDVEPEDYDKLLNGNSSRILNCQKIGTKE